MSFGIWAIQLTENVRIINYDQLIESQTFEIAVASSMRQWTDISVDPVIIAVGVGWYML